MTFTPQVLTANDANNSTNTTLAINATFIGTSTNTTGYDTLILNVKSDVNSSAGGIQIQFSGDGTTFYTLNTITYFASSVLIQNYQVVDKYYRIIYTNDGTAQTSFDLSVRLSTTTSNTILNNTSITSFNNEVENTMDAFGKLRVSNPSTILDIRFPPLAANTGNLNFQSNNLQICSAYSAPIIGTSNYFGTYADSKLVISATGAGYYVSQSRNYCVYQPGKSLLFLASGILYPGDNSYTTRIGYFDNNTPLSSTLTVKNGLYFQHSGGVYSVNIINNGSSYEAKNQSDWNIDKMNGTGPSGLNLDFTKAQLFVIDLEWLSVGRIRFGFYAYGRIQYCHQVTNINNLSGPYTTYINLPICYTIHSSTGTTTVNNFTQICSTVMSEGGYTPIGKPFSISNDAALVTVGDSETPILFLRGGSSNYYHQNIIPSSLTVVSSSANDFMFYRVRLYLAPNSPEGLTIINWNDVNPQYSVCQYAKTYTGTYAPTIEGSIVIDEGYFFGRGNNTYESFDNVFSSKILQLTSNANNEHDILVITCRKGTTGGSAANVYGALTWQEVY